jgi:hypothetical protein
MANKKETLINLLLSNPEGLPTIVLQKELKTTRYVLYHCVREIKKKNPEYSIINEYGKYRIIPNDANENKKKSPSEKEIPKRENGLIGRDSAEKSVIDQALLQKLHSIAPNDARDIIEMLKKSIFYRNSAYSLLKASEDAQRLIQSIN